MQDITDRVGVHQTTVSNILSGKFKPRRSDAVRRADEIKRVAVKMGYLLIDTLDESRRPVVLSFEFQRTGTVAEAAPSKP